MGYKGAADTLEGFQYDIMNYTQFPEKHWIKIKITYMMKRANKELKTRSRG